jgi:hypothetical protein
MLSGQFPVKGASVQFAQFRSNGRIGRVDFQLRNLGTADLIIAATECDADGSNSATIGSTTTVKPGGIQTMSLVSAKALLRFKSHSSNVNSGTIQLDAQFLGRAHYGQLTLDENLPNSAFATGANLNGSGL